MSGPIRETIVLSRGNQVRLAILSQDPVTSVISQADLGFAQRMVLQLVKKGVVAATVDSAVAVGSITWGDGRVTLDVGDVLATQSVTPDIYDLRLTGIDGAGKKFELIHETFPRGAVQARVSPSAAIT